MRSKDEFEKYVREGGMKKRRAARVRALRLAGGGAVLCVCLCIGAAIWLSPMMNRTPDTPTQAETGAAATFGREDAVTEVALSTEYASALEKDLSGIMGGEICKESAVAESDITETYDSSDAGYRDPRLPTAVDIYTLPAEDNTVVTHIVDLDTVDLVGDAMVKVWNSGEESNYDGIESGVVYYVKFSSESAAMTYTFTGNYISCNNGNFWCHHLTDADAQSFQELLDELMKGGE